MRQRAAGQAFSVRFTWAGVEHEPSSGTADPELAAREGGRIYSDVVSREPKPKQRTKSGTRLEELIEKWLVSILATHDPKTVKTWKLYAESQARGCHAKTVNGNRRWAGVRTLNAIEHLTIESATERLRDEEV